jgi:hypothetical protein
MPATEVACTRCGTTFVATRKNARFCGAQCRQDAYSERRRLMRTTELRGQSQGPSQANRTLTQPADADELASAQDAVAETPLIATEQPRLEVAAVQRGPLAASGGFIVIPPVMLVLGLTLVVLGQPVSGLIEVGLAVAVFTGLYIWGSRHR